jgi:hypothetical protein
MSTSKPAGPLLLCGTEVFPSTLKSPAEHGPAMKARGSTTQQAQFLIFEFLVGQNSLIVECGEFA